MCYIQNAGGRTRVELWKCPLSETKEGSRVRDKIRNKDKANEGLHGHVISRKEAKQDHGLLVHAG